MATRFFSAWNRLKNRICKVTAAFFALVLLALTIVPVAVSAIPNRTQDSAKSDPDLLKKLATPGEHHRNFDALAGKWRLQVRWRNKPDESWSETGGAVEYRWILGKRFMLEEFRIDMAGESLEWLGIYGFDNFQKKYTAVWVDNMGTNTEFAEGVYDGVGRAFSFIGEQDDPPTGGKRQFKWAITFEGTDRLRFDSHDQDPPGKYFKNTEAVATRIRE